MRNTIILIAVAIVVTFLATRSHAADETVIGDWQIGQVISIPSPDNPLISNRLTVLDATEWGEWAIVDQDGDVFSCLGAVSADACQSIGKSCPKSVGMAARLPGIGASALWMCSETPMGRSEPPADYAQGKSCPDNQRLWVDMSNGHITGYRCAE